MTTAQKWIKYFAIGLAVFLIIQICSWILLGLRLVTGNVFSNSSEINFSEEYISFDMIKVDTLASNILIQEGSSYRVEAKGVNKNFSSVEKNGVLEIKEKKSIFFETAADSEIIITVPNATELQKISIEAGAGKAKIIGIDASELDIFQGAGILEIENSLFDIANINGGAGHMKIKNSIMDDLDLDGGVGEISLHAKITDKADIDCGIGDISLDLMGFREDYRLTIDKGIGSVYVAGEEMGSHTETGNGIRQINVDGGVGKITVDFEN